MKPWTAEEARQFLESARRDQDPLYAANVLILVLGLRKGEIVGLPRSAVNLDGGELDVGWQLQRVRRQLLHRETKTEASEGVRRITVHDMRHTCAALLAALDVQPRVAMRILRHAQIDVTMNVYTEVSDEKTLKALKRLGRQLGS